MVMRVHYLQHIEFEGPGTILLWLLERGHAVTATHLYLGEPLPAVEDFDLLIVLGGPMGVDDEIRYPWLLEEKRLISRVIGAGKRILGICRGAQLIAWLLGASVTPNRFREIGWFEITAAEEGKSENAEGLFPPSMKVLHWHGDTFELPYGAVPLAHSRACTNQGFVLENRVIGLQFHLETTPESARQLVENSMDEFNNDSPWVQSALEILSVDEEYYRVINRQMERVLSFLLCSPQWEGDLFASVQDKKLDIVKRVCNEKMV